MGYHLWSQSRRLYGKLAEKSFLYKAPPFADHVELFFFVYACYLLQFQLDLGIDRNFMLMPILLSLIVVLHIIRGTRWQLYPLYIMLLLLFLWRSKSPLAYTTQVILLVLSALLSILFPMIPRFLPHRDTDNIGVQDFCLRAPMIGPGSEFWIKLYYPCKAHQYKLPRAYWLQIGVVLLFIVALAVTNFSFLKSAYFLAFILVHIYFEAIEYYCKLPSSDYMPDNKLSHIGLARYMKLPSILFSHLSFNTLCCYEDAEPLPATNQLRVVFVLHGLSGLRTSYSALCMRLASEGYLVVSPEFGDGTPAVTVLPDNHRFYEPFVGKPATVEEHLFRHTQLQHRQVELNTIMQFLDLLNRDITSSGKLALVFASMCRTVRWRLHGPLVNSAFVDQIGGKIDINGVDLIGHSFGAATALYCSTSSHESSVEFRDKYKIRSVVLYDPWMYPLSDNLREGKNNEILHYPILCMHAQYFQWAKNLEFETSVIKRAKALSIQLRFNDAGHVNYTELGFVNPFLGYRLGSVGKQDPEDLLFEICDLTVSFLKLLTKDELTETNLIAENIQDRIEKMANLCNLLHFSS